MMVMDSIFKQFGQILDEERLPSSIMGLTEFFMPGRPFSNAELRRLGGDYTKSAIEGYYNYLQSVTRQIYHTDSVQRVRALEKYLRKTSELLEKEGQGLRLPNFIANINEYANLLAGKKSRLDRIFETYIAGRQVYGAMKWIASRTGANMIAGNISAALTNFIPYSQLLATSNKFAVIRGSWESMITQFKKEPNKIDGVESGFLIRRYPEKHIDMTKIEKGINSLAWLFETIDKFMARTIINTRYYENISKGMDKQKALADASDYTGRVVTDRSYGQLPNLFNIQTLRAATMFQTEINNVYSFVKKDIPRMYKDNTFKIASAIAQFFIYSYMFNEIYEKATGRRPVLDLIYTTKMLLGLDEDVEDVELKERILEAGSQLAENLPFAGIIAGGGRFPISAGIPNITRMIKNPESIPREIAKPMFYLLPPAGGAQAKKTIESLISSEKGYVDSTTGLVHYPFEEGLKPLLFGKYSTDEARKYFKGKLRPLGKRQSEIFKRLPKEKQLKYYEYIMKKRKLSK